MIQIRDLTLPIGFTAKQLQSGIAKRLHLPPADISNVQLLKQSVDARKKQRIQMVVTAGCTIKNPREFLRRNRDQTITPYAKPFYTVPAAKPLPERPVIVGSGPAGLFAAWVLAKAGAKPIVLERGMDVDSRTRSVERFWKTGTLDSDCNVQFGEGGAGTFSDGKLTTGTKDPRIRYVIDTFAACGAPKEIRYQAKPHIGTDKLAQTVKTMRERICELGGTYEFGACFCDYEAADGSITAVIYEQNGQRHTIPAQSLILAIGHSARDVFSLLHEKGVRLEQKNFAVGVRIEHLQSQINLTMYGDKFANHPELPAADYKLVTHLPTGRSLYTFCMCPGGQVVAAASESEHLVTNGMSLFARDGKNANSALLVGVQPGDFGSDHPLAGVEFQRRMEHAAYLAGGGGYAAPVTLVGDFLKRQLPTDFGSVLPTYQPNTAFADPGDYLPDFVCDTLREGLPRLGRLLPGFDTPDAVLTGVESRSSSPVRIVRDESGQSVSLRGLFPCGEGAGYAGGIVSAAVDGIRCAERILCPEA